MKLPDLFQAHLLPDLKQVIRHREEGIIAEFLAGAVRTIGAVAGNLALFIGTAIGHERQSGVDRHLYQHVRRVDASQVPGFIELDQAAIKTAIFDQVLCQLDAPPAMERSAWHMLHSRAGFGVEAEQVHGDLFFLRRVKQVDQVPIRLAKPNHNMTVDFQGAVDAAGFAHDVPVVIPVKWATRLFAAGLFKDFSTGAIQADADNIGSSLLDAVQALDVEGCGGNQRGDGDITQVTHAAGHIYQVIIRAVILHLGNAYTSDFVRMFGDFLSHQVGSIQGPRHTDEGVVFRGAGAFARQSAVRTVRVTAFGIILQEIDAAAGCAP